MDLAGMIANLPGNLLQWTAGSGGSETYILSRWIFLRVLGAIYLIAFVSFWVQFKGLIGSEGITPAQEYLSMLKSHFGSAAHQVAPNVFWINASNAAIHAVCALGVIGSLCVVIGFAPSVSLFLLWVLYLSITVIGQDFLSFQWDVLLLEVGFVSLFFAPTGMMPGLAHETAVSPLARFLVLWILFRLMWESGVVKLTGGDESWRNLTALNYHYFTQPLPAWTSWYMHHLPMWAHKISIIFMYACELLLPFFIFLSRPFQLIGAVGMALLQLIIMATGNYTFFNLLSIVLCIPLISDGVWLQVLPQGFIDAIGYSAAQHAPVSSWWAGAIMIIALIYVLVGGLQALQATFPRSALLRQITSTVDPGGLRIINSYGLFRVMTKTRPEIIVEGSHDGENWQRYHFKYKPGDPSERPRFVQPHQPRLDWQMWFAALSSFERTPWFQRFMQALLEGKSDVTDLLEHNPFPDRPPRYVRAKLYRYDFTSPEERKRTGDWWRRSEAGEYMPAASLNLAR